MAYWYIFAGPGSILGISQTIKHNHFGWAWRDPKYKSETELCSMLKWAKEKGLTIEELSI